jgi:hypothetical protein
MPPHPTSRRSILILSSHLRLGLSSGLLPSGDHLEDPGVISLSILLRMKNVSDTISRENQNTHFVFNNIFQKIVPFMT